jgi:hypothetical protein
MADFSPFFSPVTPVQQRDVRAASNAAPLPVRDIHCARVQQEFGQVSMNLNY